MRLTRRSVSGPSSPMPGLAFARQARLAFRASIFGGLACVLACASACGPGPRWPVPVPAPLAGGTSTRVEVALPLCGGAEQCDERRALCVFLDEVARSRGSVRRAGTAPDACDDPAIATLLEALRTPVSTDGFPRATRSLPRRFRRAHAYPVEDASAAAEDRVARAVSYERLFFAFFLGDSLLGPDDPRAGTYRRLVVFRHYGGMR